MKSNATKAISATVSTSELLYFMAYGIWGLWHILSVTMFYFFLPSATTKVVALLTLGLLIMKWMTTPMYRTNRIVLSVMVMAVFALCCLERFRLTFLTIMFLIVSAHDIDFRKIAKFSLILFLGVIIATVVSSKIGIIDNVIYSTSNRVRESLGFTYSGLVNIAFMNCIYISLFLLGRRMRWYHWILPLSVMYWMYVKTRTRTDMMLVILLFLVWLFFIRDEGFDANKKLYRSISVIIYPALALASIFCSVFYDASNDTWKRLNKFFSSRLSLGQKMYQTEGYSLFGHDIKMIGHSHLYFNPDSTEKYNYVDNGFLQVAFLYGIVVLIILVVGYTVLTYNAAKNNDKYLYVWLCFNAVENFVYPNLIDPMYNILCLALVISYSHMFRTETKNGGALVKNGSFRHNVQAY